MGTCQQEKPVGAGCKLPLFKKVTVHRGRKTGAPEALLPRSADRGLPEAKDTGPTERQLSLQSLGGHIGGVSKIIGEPGYVTRRSNPRASSEERDFNRLLYLREYREWRIQ